MRIIVPTIQHTGTWFTAYHLLADYLHNGKDTLPHDKAGDGVVLHHVYEAKIPGLRRELQTYKGLSPLRHPAELWASWSRRQRPFAHLYEQTEYLISLDCDNLFFLPIDHPDRDNYLAQASEHLSVTLSTDWPKIHEWEGEIVGESGPADFDDYMDRFGGFWSRFY